MISLRTSGSHSGRRYSFLLGLLLLIPFMVGPARQAWSQAVESADAGHASLWVGAGASGYTVQYGSRKLLGVTAWVDGETIRKLGIEGEGRWLDWHQHANVHAETYLGGLRYHFNVGPRMQPYVKGLAGLGRFNFPYNFASGNYTVIAPGGGVDYRLSRRWGVRADFEYQYWPNFTFGTMSSVGGTVGLRYRVF